MLDMSRSAINHAIQQQLREHGGVLPSSDPFAILKEITPEEELPRALPMYVYFLSFFFLFILVLIAIFCPSAEMVIKGL